MTSHASLLDLVPVIPVVVVKDVADAVPIAEALVRGGLPIIELTMRTPAALEAIERVRGVIRPDRDGYLVTWLAQVDQRPRAELLRDGVQALVWLRDFTW